MDQIYPATVAFIAQEKDNPFKEGEKQVGVKLEIPGISKELPDFFEKDEKWINFNPANKSQARDLKALGKGEEVAVCVSFRRKRDSSDFMAQVKLVDTGRLQTETIVPVAQPAQSGASAIDPFRAQLARAYHALVALEGYEITDEERRGLRYAIDCIGQLGTLYKNLNPNA